MLALLDAASCAITVGLAVRSARRGGSLRRLSASASGLGSPLPRAPEHGDCVYLDYQATTPVWPEVAEAAAPYLQLHWGNPSSGHAFGRPCAAAVSSARGAVATLVRASPSEILFTSCGSEADNHAIYGALAAEEARRRAGATSKKLPHVVTSNIEHPAIEECLKVLEAEGRLRATYVPCDGEGRVGADAVAAAVTKETILVTVMHSNNEVGAVQPVAAIAAAARAASVAAGAPKGALLVHSDAAQSIGKLAIDVAAEGVDLLTIVGHKFGAPKGVAALYVRSGVGAAGTFGKFVHGGGQEAGRRAGTECVVLQVALGKAAEIATAELPRTAAHMAAMRTLLLELLTDGLGPEIVRVNGPADAAHRLPNTLSVGLVGVRSSELLATLSESVAASAGAACHTDHAAVSAVLRAMEVPHAQAVGTLRLSTGRHTTEAEVRRAAALIIAEAKRQLKL